LAGSTSHSGLLALKPLGFLDIGAGDPAADRDAHGPTDLEPAVTTDTLGDGTATPDRSGVASELHDQPILL
jgi:hypothetical protein